MKISKLKQKGFTLVEVMIVVIILAILAGLILPRFAAQPERARAAEAVNFLGAIRRAQIQTMDTSGATTILAITNNLAPAAAWTQLGITVPAGTFFTYACANTSCTATRNNIPASNSKVGGIITLDVSTGVFTCDGTTYVAQNGQCV